MSQAHPTTTGRKARVAVSILAATFCASANVAAQEPAPTPAPAAAAPSRLLWHAFVSASYTGAFDGPQDGVLGLRVFDSRAGKPRLDIVSVGVAKPAAPLGFRLDVAAGKSVPAFASYGAWDPDVADVKQAFLTWKPGTTEFQAGKFVTSAGYEVIEDWDNPNPTFSRSFLFGYAIPFAHTGLRVSRPLGRGFTAMAGVNRGWDRWRDDNSSVSWEAALFATPNDRLSLTFDTHHGPEQSGNTTNWRHLFDVVAIAKVSPGLSLGLNLDYARESGAAAGRDATWGGAAAYITRTFPSGSSLSLRLEEFRDRQGVRTGTPQTLRDADLTFNWKIYPRVLLRLDGRIDRSDAAVFDGPNGARRKSRTTVAGAIVFSM